MWGEDVGKVAHGVGVDRFCAAKGDLPPAEVELLPLFGGDFFNAEFVGEVGGAADGAVVTADGLEPAERPLEKRRRSH